MAMTLRLVGPFADLVLRVGAASPARVRFVDPEAALALLRPALALSPAYRDLRTLVFEAGQSPMTLDDEALLLRVARLLVSGALELERRPHELMLSKFDRYAAYISMRSVVPPYDPLVDEEHWIEVLVETDAEQPLGGVRCEITLPWGLVLRRTTDQYGLIRVDYLPRDGECVIRFPGFATDDQTGDHTSDPSDDWAVVATASSTGS